jgi:CDP-4-dehydro-6-deoxyglucose reductase
VTCRVTVAGSGETFVVGPDQSVLAAALEANLNLAHDCKSGTCGTCRVRLVSGAVAYREEPMGLMPEEAEAGYALACQARPLGDLVIEAEVQPPLAAPPSRQRAVVRDIRHFGPDVAHLTLDLPEVAGFDYLPGQHVAILMDDGRPRSFSMASAPNGSRFDLHIRRIPGGAFTDGLLPALRPGATLDVELPHGAFYLRKDDFRPLLMVATGTGLAPIKSILESLMDDPDCPPALLYWGSRAGRRAFISTATSPAGAPACRNSTTGRCCRAATAAGPDGAATSRTRWSPTSRTCRNTPSISAARRPWWRPPRRCSWNAARASTTSTPTASSSSTTADGRSAGSPSRPTAACGPIAIGFCIRYSIDEAAEGFRAAGEAGRWTQ